VVLSFLHAVVGVLGTSLSALEAWRQEFNHERPHEALDMQTPVSQHTKSPRQYCDRLFVNHFDMLDPGIRSFMRCRMVAKRSG